MPPRMRPLSVGSVLLAGAAWTALFVSCGGNSLPVRCAFTSTTLASNALTSRPDARLDRVGAGFVLFAADPDRVLASSISMTGVVGPLASLPVPTHSDGPWIAAVGPADSPGGTLVVAYAANPAAGMADLMTFTSGIDGTSPTQPQAVGKIPDTKTTPVVITAGSGRGGQHMGVAWGVQGTTTLFAKILGADGRALGADLTLGMVEDFDCLRFVPGAADLTVSYIRAGGTPLAQTLYVHEIDAAGAAGQSFNFPLGPLATSCAAIAPSATGYGTAWKEVGTAAAPGRGDYFASFNDVTRGYMPYLVLSNPRATGGSAAPIVGVGTSGNNFTLLFAQSSGAELWEVDISGRQIAKAQTLPSFHGNIGWVSCQPVGTSLFATYADYASADPTNQTAGNRLFVELSCQ